MSSPGRIGTNLDKGPIQGLRVTVVLLLVLLLARCLLFLLPNLCSSLKMVPVVVEKQVCLVPTGCVLIFFSLIVAILYVELALIIPSFLTALILIFSEFENP